MPLSTKSNIVTTTTSFSYVKELESDLKPSFIKPINKVRRSSSSSSSQRQYKTNNRLYNFNKNKKIKKTNNIIIIVDDDAATTNTDKMSIEKEIYNKDEQTAIDILLHMKQDKYQHQHQQQYVDDESNDNNPIPYAYELSIQEMYNHLLYMKQIEYKSGYFFIKN